MEDQSNSSLTCRNCGAPIQASDAFCSNCGQKNTDGRITFGNLFSEFISANFNLDSRIFRTIRDLFIPGKLTMEYFKGKHKSYVHPVRLFLVTVLFLVASQAYYSAEDDIQIGTNDYETPKIQIQLTQNKVLDRFSHLKDSIRNLATSDTTVIFLDSLESALYQNFDRTSDSITIGEKGLVFVDSLYYTVSKEDYVNLSEDELVDKYEVNGFWEKWNFTQQIRMLRDNQAFGIFFIRNLVWTMFFMMPFLALLLKLFYYKSNKFYVEHLIFSFHTHAFVFLIFGIIVQIANNIDIESNFIVWFSFVWVLIYVYTAVWRVYQQTIGRTILKVAIINILYLVLFILFLVISVVVGMLLF